jgi:hypothetical protein
MIKSKTANAKQFMFIQGEVEIHHNIKTPGS